MWPNIGTWDVSQSGVYGFLIVPFKGQVMNFPCSFFPIPSGQHVDAMLSSHGSMKTKMAEQKKEGIWILNTVRLSHQIYTHVQNNICMRNKLPSHLGIHCVESLLQQQNLSSNEWKWFWAIWRLSGKSAMLGLQCWECARAPMVSWQLFLCGYPTYSQMENFPEKLPCSSYLISSLCHLASLSVLLLTTSGLGFLYLI